LATLGVSVAVDGGLAVAGAPFDDTGAPDSGVAVVFDAATGGLLHVIPNPAPATEDYFGFSVAISGSLLVVGAYRDDTWARDVGSAFVFDLSGATPTVPIATLDDPEPSEGDFFGYRVAISGTRVVVTAYYGDGMSLEAGSAYVYDMAGATPAVPVLRLSKPAPSAYDYFGGSVGISGARVVIGATGDDTAGSSHGAVYVYDLSSATPADPVMAIHPPEPLPNGGFFGFPVAISGMRVVVGAKKASDDRRVYAYDLASDTPMVPVATLQKPGLREYDDFGYSVAIAGTRVVVGAHSDDTGPPVGGKVYIFDLQSATPLRPVVTLINPTPAVGDAFGNPVAIFNTVVVAGATGDDTAASGAGSVYVYNTASETPAVPVATLNHPGPAGGAIGNSVAIDGMRMVAGTASDNGARFSGSAHVYDLASGEITVALNNPEPAESDVFGASVAIDGTLVVVGATHDDTGATNAGSAYVYDLTGAEPAVPVFTLHNPDPAENDHFGNAVAISGTRVVVGAWFDDAGARDAGSVYVYDIAGATPEVPVLTLHNPSPAEYESFGTAVAIDGSRVVVGDPTANTTVILSGAAYVYDLTGATPAVPVVTLTKPAPAHRDDFGASVAISGARVVVGNRLDDAGATDAGSAFLFDLSGPAPSVPTVTFNNPTPVASELFGNAVAISGTLVAIGVPNGITGGTWVGTAYLYDVAGVTPAVPVATLNNPGPSQGDYFGSSVAIEGTTVAIGAPSDRSMSPSWGLVYIYHPNLLDQDTDGLPDSWEITHWSTTTGHGATDDFDHDGYEELLELAFGLNPVVPDPAGLPPVTVEDGYLTVTIAKQPGVTYEVQSATALRPDEPLSFTPDRTRVLLDNATTLKARDHFLIPLVPARYLRVKVTPAP
jgi:hypothetical protein